MTAGTKAVALVRRLSGWQLLAFAFMTGAISALAFAPLDFFPALLLGFGVLALLLDGICEDRRRVLRAALTGWAFAFGQFLIGFHWMGYAFLVDPSAHLWQLPFAVTLLPLGLGLYGGLACALAALVWCQGPARLLLLAVFYAATEWLRGHLFTGLPWNLPAYGWGASLSILQSTALFGAYGLSFLTILLGVSLADLPRGRYGLPAALGLLFLALWGWGSVRLAAPVGTVPGAHVRLVQPNIPQREKYMPVFLARNWGRLIDLSVAPSQQGAIPNIIVWPEAAPPFALARVPAALDQIAILTAEGRLLLTGAERAQKTAQGFSFFNSFYIFGPDARELGIYDKSHLVPFGEYVPFAALLNRIGITKLTAGQSGFSVGSGPQLYRLPNLPPVTPLICYEMIFPGAVAPRAGRPGWFVNVTDDSWFGPWAGPRQHLLIARVRAIEEGVPIARDANTGVSAMIDPLGRVTAQLGLGKTGFVDADLPRTVTAPPYARDGDILYLLVLLAGIGFGLAPALRR